MIGVRSQKSEAGSQKSEAGSQESGVRSQESGVGSQKSGVRSQKSGDGRYNEVADMPAATGGGHRSGFQA
jgi:hypothetical protein